MAPRLTRSGGRRDDAGRKPLPPEQRTRTRSQRLTQSQWEAVDRAGDRAGVAGSEVVRRALANYLGDDWPSD